MRKWLFRACPYLLCLPEKIFGRRNSQAGGCYGLWLDFHLHAPENSLIPKRICQGRSGTTRGRERRSRDWGNGKTTQGGNEAGQGLCSSFSEGEGSDALGSLAGQGAVDVPGCLGRVFGGNGRREAVRMDAGANKPSDGKALRQVIEREIKWSACSSENWAHAPCSMPGAVIYHIDTKGEEGAGRHHAEPRAAPAPPKHPTPREGALVCSKVTGTWHGGGRDRPHPAPRPPRRCALLCCLRLHRALLRANQMQKLQRFAALLK